MDIRITQTYAKLGIDTQNAIYNMRNNGKTDFTMRHTEPQIQIHSTAPQILIDQTQSFADEGLKGNTAFLDESVALGKQNLLQYVGKEAQEGDSFAQIQYGGKPILEAIRQEGYQTKEYDVGIMPEHAPQISLQEGEVDIQLMEGDVQTQYNYVPIDVQYAAGRVSYYLRQKNGVNIEYIGSNVDTKV